MTSSSSDNDANWFGICFVLFLGSNATNTFVSANLAYKYGVDSFKSQLASEGHGRWIPRAGGAPEFTSVNRPEKASPTP